MLTITQFNITRHYVQCSKPSDSKNYSHPSLMDKLLAVSCKTWPCFNWTGKYFQAKSLLSLVRQNKSHGNTWILHPKGAIIPLGTHLYRKRPLDAFSRRPKRLLRTHLWDITLDVYILGLLDVFSVNIWTSWKRFPEDVLGIRCLPAGISVSFWTMATRESMNLSI